MRHKKFSSIGIDKTQDIWDGHAHKSKRRINMITVHCSFSPQDRGDDAHTIDRWHREKGWSGIGYHYVVLEDGTIQKGRWSDYAGAHAKGHNMHSIGICRIGGMDGWGYATNDATPEQIEAITQLTYVLANIHNVETANIVGHTEIPNVNKSCPLMSMDQIRLKVKGLRDAWV